MIGEKMVSNEAKKKRALIRYYAKRKEILAYQTKRWSEKYKEDAEFRKKRQLRDRSRSGKRRIDVPCQNCGSTFDLQRHHPTYNSTEVIILCRSCHNNLHQELRSIAVEAIS